MCKPLKTPTSAPTSIAAANATSGGLVGAAFSGAGADATNVILTQTKAYVQDSVLHSQGAVDLDADDKSTITATIAAASDSVAGGLEGVSAAIGSSQARNLIGVNPNGTEGTAALHAFVQDCSVTATGALTIDATATEIITATVVADSRSVAAGLVAISDSGAFVAVENQVATDVRAFLGEDTTDIENVNAPITAGSVAVNAIDTSTIVATAEATSVSESVGLFSGAVSIGGSAASNDIRNQVSASVLNADDVLTTTTGDVSVLAVESAEINGIASAAAHSLALASVSGAGAHLLNTLDPATIASIDCGKIVSAGGVNVIAKAVVKSNSLALGKATATGAAVAESHAEIRSNPTVTAAMGSSVDIDAARHVNLKALYNADESGASLGHTLAAYSTGSAGALLVGILAGAESIISSTVNATASVGDNATIDGTDPSNQPVVTIASYAHNLVDALATGNVSGLVSSGGNSGTKVDVRVGTDANTTIGQGAQIGASNPAGASIYDLNIQSTADSNVTANTLGASGNSLTDALKSLFNNIVSFFSGDDFETVKVPSVLATGGTATLATIENTAYTEVGAGAELTVTSDLNIRADAMVTVDADSMMEGASAVAADATSVNDVIVDSDAIVNIVDSASAAPTQILGSNVTIAADSAVDVNSVAKAEVKADFFKGNVTSVSRVRIGLAADPSEAKVRIGDNAAVTAVKDLTIRALNHQRSAAILTRAEGRAFGGLTSTANAPGGRNAGGPIDN